MCAPALAVPLLLAGAGVSVIGGIQAGNAAEAAGKANQQIANNNAKLAEESARDANIQGARESQQSAWKTRALLATQRAAAASANVDAQLGSAFDIQSDTALLGGIEQETIMLNAARKAWGFQSEAINYRNQGVLARWEGKQQKKASILGGLGNAIGFGAQAAMLKKG
jgi:hypothetical protein